MVDRSIDRREYVGALAAAIAGSVAGCGGDTEGADGGDGEANATTTTTAGTDDPLTIETTTTAEPVAVDHPSLLVSEDVYPALQKRAREEPWATWKRKALDRATGFMAGDDRWERAQVVQDRASGAALAYVLDPDDENRQAYAEQVADAIEYYHEEIYPDLGDDWRQVVLPSGPFFTSVLALDVVRGKLPADRVTDAESKLQAVADWYWEHRDGPWKAARYGAYGVHAAYAGDVSRLRNAAEHMLEAFAGDWADGVYGAGCEYANARFAGFWGRNAKVHLLDVLAFASAADLDVYGAANEFVSRDHAWLFGHSLTPVVYAEGGATQATAPQRDCYTFGDSGPHHVRSSFSSAAYRAGKFGGTVENNAAWALVGENPEAATNAPAGFAEGFEPPNRNLFCAYVLTESVPADPDPIPSKVYEDGGAWFHGDSNDAQTLAGALWNNTRPGGHAHPDTNAVHLCAYGEHVLRNAGYNGWGNGVDAFGWEYIHDRAVANNVALVDYAIEDVTNPPARGHDEKAGGGVAEGFADDPGPVAYASGDSFRAVAGGRHVRNFLFVPPADGANGYWLLLDEVTADGGDTVHTALHPNAEQAPDADTPGFAYTVPVGGPYPRSENDVRLTVAYGTEPDSVGVYRGALADWDESFVGRYLYATYPAAAEGATGVLTALFPHDAARPRADFERLGESGVSGVEVGQDEVIDRAVELGDGEGEATVGGATVQGRGALLRERKGERAFAFVRRGTRFADGERGFRAEAPVSVALRGTVGNVAAPEETSVRFEHPGLEAVALDGERARTADAGTGYVEAVVPAGSHRLRFVTS